MIKSIDEGENKQGTLVFIHGWPDSPDIYRHQVAHFVTRGYRCIRVCLPNFDGDITHPWGADFDEIAEMVFKMVVDKVPEGEKIVLVIHDWGVVVGNLFEMKHPDVVDRVVSMDVGMYKPKLTLMRFLFMIMYQWTMAFSFLFRINIFQILFMKFGRAPGIEPGSKAVITPYMCYPYYYFWRRTIFKGEGPNAYGLNKYKPTHPHLFLYGDSPKRPEWQKFHSEQWLQHLEQLGKVDGVSRSVAMKKSDHWLQWREPEKCNEEIEAFLNSPLKDSNNYNSTSSKY